VERTVPLKALVSEINYNLFDMEVGRSRASSRICKRRIWRMRWMGSPHARCVAVERQRHFADRSTTPQYFGAIGQIEAGGNTVTIGTTASIVDGLKSTIAEMVASSSFDVRPTAIYANRCCSI